MVLTSYEEYWNKPEDHLLDSEIVDLFKSILQGRGSKEYYNKIISMIRQSDKTDGMILEFNHYDLPDVLLDPFWRFGEAKRIVKCLNEAVKQVFSDLYNERDYENRDIHYDQIEGKLILDDEKLVMKIRNVKNPRNSKNIVVFDGMVIQKTSMMQEIVKYVFKCYSCERKYNDKVKACLECESRKIDLSLEDCGISNYELITIQEHQKDMFPGVLEPSLIDVYVNGSLLDKFQPGNHVRVTGFPKVFSLKPIDEKLSKGYKTDIVTSSALYTGVEAHNIQHMKTPLEILLSNPMKAISERDLSIILSLRKKYNNDVELLNVLTNSFCEEIYGCETIKEAILIQSVGSGLVKGKRSNINILLVGDPSTGKTKMLYAAKDINIHSAMAVGKGASGVGLTASVVTVNGMPRLSVGAAVLADKGVCLIDEFSKIDDEHKSHLLECMESGTFTVNKNGINRTLNSRAAFLVASNPDNGKYSIYNSLTENIKIDPPLLSRFDLIFVITDDTTEKEDKILNIHTAAIYNDKQPPKEFIELSKDKIDPELLKKYLTYAKLNNQTVKLSKKALTRFDNFYQDLKKPVKSSDISATRRQYEGMLRISMGIARLLLKNEVTEEIADHTIKILNTAFESTGMKLGNSTGLVQNTIFAKDLTKMDSKKAAVEVIQFITESGKTPRDREYIMQGFCKHLEIYSQDAAELFEKIYPKLRMPVHNKYILDV